MVGLKILKLLISAVPLNIRSNLKLFHVAFVNVHVMNVATFTKSIHRIRSLL